VVKRPEDQTLADRDQTSADADQTASDTDQTASESDQAASDSDQAASDRDLEHGGDPVTHDITREIRDRSAQQRTHSGQQRVEAAGVREAAADERDVVAAARDDEAGRRDRNVAALAESVTDPVVAGVDDLAVRFARYREAAADARENAAQGRVAAAADRERTARDRDHTRRDREAMQDQLALAQTDALTGVQGRAGGLADLDREIARARRTEGWLVIVYVDVIGLKAVNDAEGHAAGDALLLRAVEVIRAHLRAYDLIVRLGGDEFLCVMSGATIIHARRRFEAVGQALASGAEPFQIRIGFAALEPEDNATTLIGRADAELTSSY
jgi:diguanylate cyclase (GGDEF)-like protein